MFRRFGSRMIAMIPRLSHVRRFGTLRAFVVRGYEFLQHERSLAESVAIERAPERCGIF